MLIRLSAVSFKRAVDGMLCGTPGSIGFMLDGSVLHLQLKGIVVVNMDLTILDCDNVGKCDIVARLKPIVGTLDVSEDVFISVDGDVLQIYQTGFMYRTVREPDRRIEYRDVPETKYKDIRLEGLDRIMKNLRPLEKVAAEYGITDLTLSIKDKSVIVKAFNTMYVDCLDIQDCSLSLMGCKQLMKQLKEETRYAVGDDGIMTFISGEKTVRMLCGQTDNSMSRLCSKIEAGFGSRVLTIDIGRYLDVISQVCTVFNRVILELYVGSGGLGICIQSSDGHFSFGDSIGMEFTLRMSVLQLKVLQTVFFGDSVIHVMKGEDVLCFASKDGRKKLMIAGTIC